MVSGSVVDRRCSYGNEVRECLKNWLIVEQRQNQAMVYACLLLLDDNYLLTLPLPPGVTLPESPGPRNFRFLFRRHVASLLGWTERRGEGEVHGFSNSVNNFIREVWWPDEVGKALHRAGQHNRQFGEASDPQVHKAAPVAVPQLDGAPLPEVFRHSGNAEEVFTERAAGVQSEVDTAPSATPRRVPHRIPGKQTGVDLGDGTVELGSDRSSMNEERRRNEVFIDQQLVLYRTKFLGGRSVWQRLELSVGGTVLLEQSVDGLPTSARSREDCPVPAEKKKMVRKRRHPHSSGGRSAGGDVLRGTSG